MTDKVKSEKGDTQLFNPHDGLIPRDGGPYLDQAEQKAAETRRAEVEDREPDYDNPPATAGTPLVTAGQLVAMSTSSNIPSQDGNDPLAKTVNDNTEVKFLAQPVSSISAKDIDAANPADPTVTSSDPVEKEDQASAEKEEDKADARKKAEAKAEAKTETKKSHGGGLWG